MEKKNLANLILCLIIGIFGWLALAKSGSALTTRGLFVRQPVPSPEVSGLMPQIELKKYFILGKSGNKVDGNFLVHNRSTDDIQNIDILCEFFDTDGKYMDRSTWVLHDIFKAGEVQQYRAVQNQFIHTKAGAVTCKITNLQRVKEPFFTLNRAAHAQAGHQVPGEGHSGH